jgi:small subunit ribosomal protein S21
VTGFGTVHPVKVRRRKVENNVLVTVRDNNVDQALRALKKKMQREGVYREMKMRKRMEREGY